MQAARLLLRWCSSQRILAGLPPPPPPPNVLRRVKFSSCVAAALARCDIGRVFTCVEASGGGCSALMRPPPAVISVFSRPPPVHMDGGVGTVGPPTSSRPGSLRFSELRLVSVELWLFLTLGGGGGWVSNTRAFGGVRLVSCECKPGISPG